MSASVYSSIESTFLPNLPGFRPKEVKRGPKKSQFTLVKGQVFIKDECLPNISYLEGTDDSSTMSFGTTLTKTKKNTMQETITLTFNAYFEEAQENGPPRIRKCNIYFYADDGTLKIVEKPSLNSGVQQGTLVRRAVIPKSDGSAVTLNDIRVGDDLLVYGRLYRIVDCDNATKNYMRDLGFDEREAALIPSDPHEEYRRSLEPGPSEPWGKFHAKKNDSKRFIEAVLGKGVDNKGREGFIRFGNKTLKFKCVWDNTASLYGDVLEFALQYYLSDDTVEITSIGTESKMKLLKRSKLPKNFQNTMILGEKPQAVAYFHWSDLYIGMELEVYGRKLQVADADVNTRDFYEMFDCSLGPAIVQPVPEVVVHKREIPPPTGFGSEEDSMRSVNGSLMPGPAPVKKLGESKILSFFASLLSGGIDDVDRRFVISFYVQDNTLKVVEPPVRNSGFNGGLFLSRREIEREGGGGLITEKDLYVGCKLRILKHQFLLLDSNESTLKWMEDKALPRSNFYKIVDKLRSKPSLAAAAKDGSLYKQFGEVEVEPRRVDRDGFVTVLNRFDLFGNEEGQISEHEIRTIVRANGNKLPHFDYYKVIEQIVKPTDEFK